MAEQSHPRRIHVYYLDGSEEIYEVVVRVKDPADVATYIRKSREGEMLLFMLEDRMVAIQRHAVKKIEVFPPPSGVPEPVFRDAKRIR